MPQTIEQRRAAHAWQRVEAAALTPAFSEYKRLLQGLPVALHTAGLGQTVAFYLAKGQNDDAKPHTRVLADLARWLLADRAEGARTPRALMQAIQGGDSQAYRRLLAETHAYLAWLKRFAAAHPQANAS